VMNCHLAKYEPGPFLPPWLYIVIAVGTLLAWLLYYVLSEKTRLSFRPFKVGNLTIEPLKLESVEDLLKLGFDTESLTEETKQFLLLNSKRFGSCAIRALSDDDSSIITYFPAKLKTQFESETEPSLDIEWLPRYALFTPAPSEMALVVDHVILAETHREETNIKILLNCLVSIANQFEIGNLLFWSSAAKIFQCFIEKSDIPITLYADKFIIDIEKIESDIDIIKSNIQSA